MAFAQFMGRINAFLFISFAIVFGFFPEYPLQFLTNTTIDSASALIDIRANYAGMSLAIGLFSLILLKQPNLLAQVLKFQSMVIGGLLSFRIVGLILDGSPTYTILLLLVIEITFFILSLVAYFQANSSHHSA
ncbi:MAG TPA: hypothetical protein DCS93_24445 [Microscillaceae bacterium]|nr:hypothetical protein [Microscillaceae bacterium]